MTSQFRAKTFDPILITGQIVSLQSLHYVSASFIILVLELLTGAPVTLNHVLYYSEIRTDTVLGWGLFFAYLVNAALGAYYLLLLVQRAKLCLDFALTLTFFHILTTSLYSRTIPTSFFWWLLNVGTTAITALGGEYLCMQREMEPINLTGYKKRQASTVGADSLELQRLNDETEIS